MDDVFLPLRTLWKVDSYRINVYGKSLVFQNPPNTLFLEIF